MLTPQAITLAQRQIAVDMADRRSAFERDVAQVKATAGFHGTLQSGMTLMTISQVIAREFEIRANMAWLAFSRVIAAQSDAMSDALAAQVKQHIAALLTSDCADILDQQARGDTIMRNSKMPPIEPLRDRAIEKVETEIDLALFTARNRTQQEPFSVVNNIYQPFGIVQTGAGSSARFNQQLSSAQRDEIERSLATVDEALGDAEKQGNNAAADARAVVADIRSEIARPNANMARIKSAFMAIGQTVQTLGAAKAAYDALRGAAALIGVHLPAL